MGIMILRLNIPPEPLIAATLPARAYDVASSR